MTLTVLAAHILALIAALSLKRGAGPLLALNLVVAGVLLIFVASHPRLLDDPPDWQMVGLGVFELLVIAAALAARWYARLAIPISCAVFGLHFLASAGAVAFALTFKITRLF
jgi:hypothetical protein